MPDRSGPDRHPALLGSPVPLTDRYDAALLDLDGVVYLAGEPVPHAAESLDEARRRGMRVAFVTNNASRTPAEVVERLAAVGVSASTQDVVTSAQAAATLLAERCPPGSPVLVVGGRGLREAVAGRGFEVVDTADRDPVAVVQGYTTELRYHDLAEAALAVRAGAAWIASNPDVTMPTPRGLVPGNGALVAAVVAATGRRPTFAGKPELPLHEEAIARTGARRPLVVGDRLDTDVAGAINAGAASLLVLTGVTSLDELIAAEQRPSFVGLDLRALLQPHPAPELDEPGARCAGWRARVDGERVLVEPPGDRAADPQDGIRAACAAAWAASGSPREVVGLDVPYAGRARAGR